MCEPAFLFGLKERTRLPYGSDARDSFGDRGREIRAGPSHQFSSPFSLPLRAL